MVIELRLNLRSPLMRCRDGFVAAKREKDGMELALSCPQHLQSPDADLPQVNRRQSTGVDGLSSPLLPPSARQKEA
jgi:hypothetical protein